MGIFRSKTEVIRYVVFMRHAQSNLDSSDVSADGQGALIRAADAIQTFKKSPAAQELSSIIVAYSGMNKLPKRSAERLAELLGKPREESWTAGYGVHHGDILTKIAAQPPEQLTIFIGHEPYIARLLRELNIEPTQYDLSAGVHNLYDVVHAAPHIIKLVYKRNTCQGTQLVV